MAGQAFTKNHRDHSNDAGFQFEFFCDKCGNGHRSSFRANKLGIAAQLVKAAGALLGGDLSRASQGAEHVQDAFRGPAWDSAYQEAVEELRPRFKQCTLCGTWVCPEVCWNHQRGLCERCAPNLGEHAPAMQAQAALEQARQRAGEQDQLRGFDIGAEARVAAHCAKCQAALAAGAKFCAQCGATVATAAATASPKFCAHCGGGLTSGARFCPGCGTAVA